VREIKRHLSEKLLDHESIASVGIRSSGERISGMRSPQPSISYKEGQENVAKELIPDQVDGVEILLNERRDFQLSSCDPHDCLEGDTGRYSNIYCGGGID